MSQRGTSQDEPSPDLGFTDPFPGADKHSVPNSFEYISAS